MNESDSTLEAKEDKKKKIGSFVRIFISLFFLGALVFVLRDQLPQVLEAVKSANQALLFAALFVFLIPQIMLLAFRLKLIFKVQKINLGFFYLYHLRFIGFFFNNFLPSAVGGDLMCAYLSSRRTGKGLESFAGIFIDRMIGFLTIFMLAIGAFFIAQQKFQIPYLQPLLIGVIIFFVLAAFFFFSRRVARPFKILVSWLPEKAYEKMKTAYHAVYQYKNHPVGLFNIIGISLILQALAVYITYLLAIAIGMPISLLTCFLLLPLVWVASMIPSLGGLGVREGAYVLFFAAFGGADKAFALSILYLGLTICASGVGAIGYLFEAKKGKVTREELEKMQKEDMEKLEREYISG